MRPDTDTADTADTADTVIDTVIVIDTDTDTDTDTVRSGTAASAAPVGFDLVALDMAGTTIEEHGAVYAALRDAVEAAGVPVPAAALERWMGADKRAAVTALLAASGRPEPAAETVRAVYGTFRARLAAAYRDRPPTALPGVEAALARLREHGVRVALTTGFDREVVDGLLAALGWESGVVDAVLCADDVPVGRPAPYLIFRAMERTGVTDVSRVLCAGDTELDLRAGANAGAGAIVGVLTGAHGVDILGRTRHTHLLASVADLPDLVLGASPR
ncbi:phosphonatase-like hydrolase [Frankia sp. AgB32]|uniref:phosphonatase-like hydrolase n=1 Tax=Frankia sp. AgB32 TaxID=631119 RepID=UPI00200E348E|nr:phosphonatase-like hydrolase [Frankia sp. AgB32]MCK9893646.1 phosphonatase-like hydrolase [Frankia sp. AgB32]